MHAIKIEALIDEPVAKAIPGLRPLLGQRVELIALQSTPNSTETISLDDFLARSLQPPAGVSVSLEEMENAIAKGARGEID